MKLITDIQGKRYDFDNTGQIKLGPEASVGNPRFAEYFQVVDNGSLGGSVATFSIIAFISGNILLNKTISVRVGQKYFFTDVEKMIMTSDATSSMVMLKAEEGISIHFNKVVLK